MNTNKFISFPWTLVFVLLLLFMANPATPQIASSQERKQSYDEAREDAMGVCPPFNLLDEKGDVIDPTRNINTDVPYSPKRTCGKCHNYDKITQGYHFQQGKGEKMTNEYAQTYPWCKSPGQYGGRW